MFHVLGNMKALNFSILLKVLFLLYFHRYLGELGDHSLIKVVKVSSLHLTTNLHIICDY